MSQGNAPRLPRLRLPSGEALKAAAQSVITFFEEVEGSIRGHLNVEELARVSLAALAAGGGFYSVLQGVLTDAEKVFPATTDAALAAAVLTGILEAKRRLSHGSDTPKPARVRPFRSA